MINEKQEPVNRPFLGSSKHKVDYANNMQIISTENAKNINKHNNMRILNCLIGKSQFIHVCLLKTKFPSRPCLSRPSFLSINIQTHSPANHTRFLLLESF